VRLVAVTSCPTGIAHTYMAAEALEQAALAAGHEISVETQGAAGMQPLDPELIAAADAVIFGVDVEVRERQRFAGKPLVSVSVKKAISEAPAIIEQVVEMARTTLATSGTLAAGGPSGPALSSKVTDGAGNATRVRQWLMTGVSYMIPFVAGGGILIALSFMLAQVVAGKEGAIKVVDVPLETLAQNFDFGSGMQWAGLLFQIGHISFGFLVPALAGFIAFAIADRPGIVPGFVGGAIAVSDPVGAGFLGGIAAGFLGGLIALWLARRPVPKAVRATMPVVVIPLVSTLLTGALMILVLGRPLKWVSDELTKGLNGMSGTNLVIMGVVLGLMMAFDMGGPVNKVAYTFATTGLAAVGTATDATELKVMAAVMAAGMTPPLGLALATVLRPSLFTEPERENGVAAWLLGASFITEGAIPFAAGDPLRVIPSLMLGSAVTGGMVMGFGSTLLAPHGGLWVTPLIGGGFGGVMLYLLAVVAGTVITALTVLFIKGARARSQSQGEKRALSIG
jgi:PTS system fructose-specific IIC component